MQLLFFPLNSARASPITARNLHGCIYKPLMDISLNVDSDLIIAFFLFRERSCKWKRRTELRSQMRTLHSSNNPSREWYIVQHLSTSALLIYCLRECRGRDTCHFWASVKLFQAVQFGAKPPYPKRVYLPRMKSRICLRFLALGLTSVLITKRKDLLFLPR